MKSLWKAALAAILLAGCGLTEVKSEVTKSHHDGDKFRNNYAHDDKGAAAFMRWITERKNFGHDDQPFPVANSDSAVLKSNQDKPSITWIGHSSFLVQIAGINILTDPHLTERASPVSFAGPERITPVGLDFDDLPVIDLIVVSHNHYDHLDEETVLEIVQRQPENPPQIFVPLRLKAWFDDRDIPSVTELDWWEQDSFADWRIHAVPVQHFSSRSLWDKNETLWAGWVLERDGFRLFFAGDTGYSRDFKDIGARFKQFDLALIPIGAYDPRWFMQAMHVAPEESVQIHQDIGARYSIGMHWGTFRLTDEPMDEPPARLATACAAAGLRDGIFTVMQHGETRALDFLFEGTH